MTISRKTRKFVLHRDGHKCVYCLRPVGAKATGTAALSEATLDHVFPKSKGGTDDTWNLVTACQPCNQKKADGWSLEFVAKSKPVGLTDRPRKQNKSDKAKRDATAERKMRETWSRCAL